MTGLMCMHFGGLMSRFLKGERTQAIKQASRCKVLEKCGCYMVYGGEDVGWLE